MNFVVSYYLDVNGGGQRFTQSFDSYADASNFAHGIRAASAYTVHIVGDINGTL